MYGWTGKLLRIDLSTQRISEETIPTKILHQFLGGKGLGTYYLYREVPPRCDPLAPENRFYLAAGPAQGTRIPITGRCTAVSKSPLTKLYIDSGIGGFLGPELKRAGYDLLIIQGTAEKPVWINISPEEHAIKDAKQLWGKTTHETELILRREDSKTQVVSTGPAGEHLVKIACLTHNYFRNFGRGGLGTIFGAKKLKAIAIRGEKHTIPTPNLKKETTLLKELSQRSRNAKQKGHALHFHGTPWLVEYSNTIGMFPTHNFQSSYFKEFEKISTENLEASVQRQMRRTPCEGCVISCAWTIKKRLEWASPEQTGLVPIPEYETLGLMGGNLGIDDPLVIIQANHLCNNLGLDTISTGNVIGLLMEASERDLIPNEFKLEGLRFGEAASVVKLLPRIAFREGIGDRLANGVHQFAQDLGAKAEQIAIHVKGLELPAWDPRGKLGLGLSYATAAAGASHLRGWPTTTRPPNTTAVKVLHSLIEQQNLKILKDSLIICHFAHSISPKLTIKDCARILTTATGLPTTSQSITHIAERIWLLARMFNIREFEQSPRHYDVLPSRLMNAPIPDGPTKGFTAFINQQDFEESLTQFYQRRGCSADGRPTKTTLQEYGLTEIVAT